MLPAIMEAPAPMLEPTLSDAESAALEEAIRLGGS